MVRAAPFAVVPCAHARVDGSEPILLQVQHVEVLKVRADVRGRAGESVVVQPQHPQIPPHVAELLRHFAAEIVPAMCVPCPPIGSTNGEGDSGIGSPLSYILPVKSHPKISSIYPKPKSLISGIRSKGDIQ